MKVREYRNLDADESIFFERELQHVKSETFDIKYPELKARDLLPVDFSAGPAADTIKYDQFSQVGTARLIANYADDLPRADVGAKEFISPVKSEGMSYGWNVQEIRSARATGKSLTTRKADAAKRGHMSLENNIAWFGDAECGLPGLLTNPNINAVTIPNDGTGSSQAWADKTPDQIIRDINLMFRTVHSVSKGVEQASILLLPLTQYNLVFDTPRSTQSDMSVGKWVLENSPHLQGIDWLPSELEGTGPGNSDQILAYDRNPRKLTLEIPQDFEQFPVQERNLEFIVPTHSRIGGTIVYYPLSVALGNGI